MEFRDEDYMLLLYKTELLFVAVFQAQSLRDSDVICVSNPVDFLHLKSAFPYLKSQTVNGVKRRKRYHRKMKTEGSESDRYQKFFT